MEKEQILTKLPVNFILFKILIENRTMGGLL